MLTEKQFQQILEDFNLSEEEKQNIIYTEKLVYDIIDFNDLEKTTKILNKKIREIKKDIYFPKKFLFFHGTGRRNRKSILEKGLLRTTKKTKKSIQSTPGYVYLSLNPESAKLFGSLAYAGEKLDVYAILVAAKDIKPDKDQIYNKNLYGNEKLSVNIVNSLLYGNGVCVKKDIELYNLRLCNHILGIEENIDNIIKNKQITKEDFEFNLK